MNWTTLIAGALVLAVHLPAVSTAADREVYFDRRGDYLRARFHNPHALYSGRGYRAIRFVPTAYYRTDDYFFAMAYRPAPRGPRWTHHNLHQAVPGTIIEKHTSAFRYTGRTTNNYRLALPATFNDSIAYRKTVIPISRVNKPATRTAPVAPPAAAPAAPVSSPVVEPTPEATTAPETSVEAATAKSPVEPATASAPEPSVAQPEVSPDASPFPNPTPVFRKP